MQSTINDEAHIGQAVNPLKNVSKVTSNDNTSDS